MFTRFKRSLLVLKQQNGNHMRKQLIVHLLYLIGVSAFVEGCWSIYHPLGWILGGVLLVALSMLVEKDQKN
jgi:hypothetical protein